MTSRLPKVKDAVVRTPKGFRCRLSQRPRQTGRPWESGPAGPVPSWGPTNFIIQAELHKSPLQVEASPVAASACPK